MDIMQNYREEYYNYLYPRSKKLKEKLKSEIKKKGKITFARYMEIVLYDEALGYYFNQIPYEDYLTSPKIHPVFGKLIATKILEMWEKTGCPRVFTIVETGAGDGSLCRQILDSTVSFYPEFHKTIKYIILCINSGEAKNLKEISPEIFPVIYKNFKIPLKNITGCFISNELLDAFPVHRVTAEKGELKEIFVTVENDEILEVIDTISTEEIRDYFKRVDILLPEGNRSEVNLLMIQWLRETGKSLQKGYILTIDYGYEASEFFSEKRKEGTLLCYYRHTFNSSPYKRPGYQDITAHVDFTALIKEGEKAGLPVEEYTTQRDFLLNLGIEEEINKSDRNRMNLMDFNRKEKSLERLIDSRGLGRIKVLIQKSERVI